MYAPVSVQRCDPARSPHGTALPSRLRLLAIAALALVLGLNDALAQRINNPAGTTLVLPPPDLFTGLDSGSASGGAIFNSGTLRLNPIVTFTGNKASSNNGGAIFNAFAAELIANSSNFDGNTAGKNGGAIENSAGSMTITNSTFTGNIAKTNVERFILLPGS